MRVSDVLVGKRVRCPKCQNVMQAREDGCAVPALQTPLAPAPVRNEAVQTVTTLEAVPPALPAAPASGRDVANTPDAPPPSLPLARPWRRRSPCEFPAFIFEVRVVSDPVRQLRGKMLARVSPEGLRLHVNEDREYFLPLDTVAHYPGGQHFIIELGQREIRLSIIEPGLDRRAVARDLVQFLKGKRDGLYRADYWPPRWPLLLAPMPLLVVLIGAGLWLAGIGGIAGFVTWGVLGLLLSLSSLLLVGLDRGMLARRLAWPAVLTFLGLILMPVLYGVGVGLGSLFDTSPRWSKYTSPDGRWAIQMPAAVKSGTAPAPGLPQLVLEKYEAKLFWSRSEFVVITGELNRPGLPRLSPEQRFAGAKDGALKGDPQLRFVKENNITLNGRYPGRDMHFTHAVGGRVRFRVYIVESTLYVLGVGSKSLDDKELDKFLDSFELLQPHQAGKGAQLRPSEVQKLAGAESDS
jgi:hypothetical protein